MPNRLPIIILLEEHSDYVVNEAYHLIMRHLHNAGYDTHAIEWPAKETYDQIFGHLKFDTVVAENLLKQTAEFLTKALHDLTQTNDAKLIIQQKKKYFADPNSHKEGCIALLYNSMDQNAQITSDSLLELPVKSLTALSICFERFWVPAPVIYNGKMLISSENTDHADRRELLTRYRSTSTRLELYISLQSKMKIVPIDRVIQETIPYVYADLAQRDRVMSFALASKYLAGKNIVMVAGKNHLPGIFAELSAYNLASNVLFFDMNSEQTLIAEISKINPRPRCKFASSGVENPAWSLLGPNITPVNLQILQKQTNLLAIEANQKKFQGYPFLESLFVGDPNDPSIAECITAAAKAHILPVGMRKINMSSEPLIFTQPRKPPALSFDPIASHALLASMITASLMLCAFISLQSAKYKRKQLRYNRPKNR